MLKNFEPVCLNCINDPVDKVCRECKAPAKVEKLKADIIARQRQEIADLTMED